MTANQVTLTSSGAKTSTNNETYIYYAGRHKKHGNCQIPGVSAKFASRPLMLNEHLDVSAVPETYNVSLSTPQSNLSICPDSTANLSATINLEKVSSFTGNYPGGTGDNKQYKEVSKKRYRMAARKMRKIKRNEAKVASKTGTVVEARSSNS